MASATGSGLARLQDAGNSHKDEDVRCKPGVSPAYVEKLSRFQVTIKNVPHWGGSICKTFHFESPNLVLNS
jgi:hypothetical protein